jgi:membrane protein implicated in regulation of membrane protease activity
MADFWWWAIAAAILAGLEIAIPGAFLIWIALGCVVTAAAAYGFGLDLTGQLLTFALAALASCALGVRVYRSFAGRGETGAPPNDKARDLVGSHGLVTVPFAHGHGKVTVAGSEWMATGPDLEEGAPVTVTGLDGTVLHVRRRSH